MRLALTSDLHGHLPPVPDCDLVVIAGDLGPPAPGYFKAGPAAQAFLTDELAPWLEALPAPAVGIAGNHDFIAQARPDLMRALPWTYLQNESAVVSGLNLWGSPNTPETPNYNGWAFVETAASLSAHYAAAPANTHIAITHGPPAGILDSGYGCPQLRDRIADIQPALHVFGHIHTDHGQHTEPTHPTRYFNVAHVNNAYAPAHPVVLVDL